MVRCIIDSVSKKYSLLGTVWSAVIRNVAPPVVLWRVQISVELIFFFWVIRGIVAKLRQR